MREVPDCLNRRYIALDNLIQELSMIASSQNFESRTDFSDDPSIKLMCEFWDILKEDPDCNLTQAVKHRMGLSTTNSSVFGPHHVTCYMAGSGKKCGGNKKCCRKDEEPSKDTTPKCSKDQMKDSGSTVSCKKCSAKEKAKTDDTALTIKDNEEEVKEIPVMIIEDEVKETKVTPPATPKVTPPATPKVPSREKIREVTPPLTPKICCKAKLERPKYKICCKDKFKEKYTPRIASRQSPTLTVPKDKVKEIPVPKVASQEYLTPRVPSKERLTRKIPSRDRVVIRVPKDKDPIKEKLKEISALIKAKDSTKVTTKESCKMCSVMEKIKSVCSPVRSRPPRHDCGQGPPPKTDSSPLSKALCNLKQAASHDKQCHDKIQDLIQNQTQLKVQIQRLEERENQGLQMLKKADCMWTCMEDCYKKKLEDSQQRQKDLLRELKKVEQNNNKWRKNNKELEFQMSSLNKIQQEMSDKINQKKNDIKLIDAEIENLKKRVDNYSKETDSIKKSMDNRKNASNAKVSTYGVEVNKFQNLLIAENRLKLTKEKEGAKYIKEARGELQKICKVLLQKRLQNEDLRAEKKALEDEIELLKQTLDQCRDKCSLKQKRMKEEIKKLTDEIANFELKCLRCHQCTDTEDIRKLCTDCPKCKRERECKSEGEYCVLDPTMDCVCQSVKQKFLDNVFENMYTVLARQSKTAPGKAVADVILKCLRMSTNGKLNDETRKILQEFILTTVKKNLNLTIVGGAVKTRCEMDSDTYNQLMSCLKDVEAVKPPKDDKGTVAKKASCRRWGGSNECNCPHGPKSCVCTKKAPPPLDEPGPNPPPNADDPGEEVKCPHKDTTSCGVDCAMHAPSNETSDWKRDPCKSPTSCGTFSTNMRAAQCVLGPESLMRTQKRQNGPPAEAVFEDSIKSKNDKENKRLCVCGQDAKHLKAGIWEKSTDNNDKKRWLINYRDKNDAYTEITPIAKLSKKIHTEHIVKEVKAFSNDVKKCLKIIIDKNRSNSNLSLTKTPSGNLGIVLSENVVKIIDQMTLIDPQLIASLNRDKKLTFHYEKSDDDNEYYVFFKRTLSGSRLLEVDSKFIDAINKSNNITEAATIIHTYSNKQDENTSSTDLKSSKSSKKGSKNRSHSISKTLNKMYDESKSVKLTVQGENGLTKCIDVPLTRTLSGSIAVNIDKVLSLGEIASNFKDYPVKLSRTKTGSILLNITKCNDHSNAIIKKTSSGSLLLLPTEPVLKYTDSGYSPRKEKYFKLKIKDRGTFITEPQFMIKPTPSNRYLLVVDKEYSNLYKRALSDCVGNDAECCIKMSRTKSCNFEIIIDEANDFNARLIESPSGDIEIIPDESDVNKLNKKGIKTLREVLESSSISSNKPRKTLNSSRLITKSNSDSSLLDRVKILTPDNKELLLQPSELRKTDSGQYAIILNKSSKKAFINNLKTYLKNNHHGLIPVRRTNPGEMTIALGSDYNKKSAFGSLKVTHSGNIYLIQNKNDVGTVSKVDKKSINVGQTNSFTGKKSLHYIDKVQQPVNKAVATNCNANPDSCFCDSSKCICEQLHKCTKDEIKESIISKEIKESIMSFYRPNICGVDWKNDVQKNPNKNYKVNVDTDTCTTSLCNERFSNENRSSQKVIKKCNAISPVFPNHPHSTEQCYLLDTICSYHVGQYKCVSNHLLEIPVICDKAVENKAGSRRVTIREPKHYNNIDWESIEYLPPQLPYFLTPNVLT